MAESAPPAIAKGLSDTLSRLAPEVLTAITGLHAESWKAVDPGLLEVCRLRIAMLQGDTAELARRAPHANVDEAKIAELASWPDSPRFTEAERACLAFTEQFVADVSSLTRADVDAVLAHLDPEAAYGFVTALLALDEHQRLSLALGRVLGPQEE